MEWSQPVAELIQAACAHARGDRARAVTLLRRAAAGFDGANMALHATVARSRLAALVGGGEGDSLSSDAAAWMAQEGVVAPERMIAMMAPGFTTG
jgi:hypothetical protein